MWPVHPTFGRTARMPHRPSRPLRRGSGAVLVLLLLAFIFPACEDERGTVNDPDQPPVGPDSEFIYATTLFSTSVFRVQNSVIDMVRSSVVTRADLPAQFSGFGGSVIVQEVAPNLFQVTFTNFNEPELAPL